MPLSDEEIAEARKAIWEQRGVICEDLEAAGVDVSSWDDRTEARATVATPSKPVSRRVHQRTMTRNQEPMSDDELAEAKESLEELREQVREDLAEDLGGDPEDYDATRHPVPDGGDSE